MGYPDGDAVVLSKDALRRDMKTRRRSLSEAWVGEVSRRVKECVESWDRYRDAATVMFYVSFSNEVETAPLIGGALSSGKAVCVPRIQVVGRRMTARSITGLDDDLEPGAFGIPAPPEDAPVVDPSSIDVVMVPGLAFDRRGYRVGFGGGYYDGFLGSLSRDCAVLGVAFGFQVVGAIAEEEHDIPVQYLATEDGITVCGVT